MGDNYGKKGYEENAGRDFRPNGYGRLTNSVLIGNQHDLPSLPRNLLIPNIDNGPGEDESIGLNIEGRKRSRTGHETQTNMDTDEVMQITGLAAENTLSETTLSTLDCVVTNQTNLSKLARQASQSK